MGELVVTAPFPGHLYCMNLLEKSGMLTITEEPAQVSLWVTVSVKPLCMW